MKITIWAQQSKTKNHEMKQPKTGAETHELNNKKGKDSPQFTW